MAGKPWLPWWPKSWNPFSRTKVPSAYDYDAILESLTEEIEVVELTLADIKARRRRAVSSVLRVILTGWVMVLLVLWGYTVVVHNTGDEGWVWYHSFYLVGLVLGTPVMLVVLHHLVTLWFRRLEKAQETHLQTLRVQRRQKINEIKKATDFEHLRRLLERYDDDPHTSEPSYTQSNTHTDSDAPHGTQLRSRASMRSLKPQPSREGLSSTRATEPRPVRDDRSRKPAPPITGMPIMGVPSAPPPRGWMDKVADMILGTDPYGASLEDQQYALICRNCFRHNGLVPKSELNEIRTCPADPEYVCPHCNTFNSRRPSSEPVSSPFATQHDEEPAQGTDGEEAPRPLSKKPSHASLPPDAVKLPWQTKTSGVDESKGQRRSARLRAAHESQEKADESMQVDE